MNETKFLSGNFSTTKLLSKIKQSVVIGSEDTFTTANFLPKNKERLSEGGLRTKGYFKHSYHEKPLISIVTIVYNGQQYIEETIRSVLNQDYDNVEYIIIDGGSTDNTLDIIKKYADGIDYWVSEPDKGIYDAMNKGIMLSFGEWIGTINSDDYYNKDIFGQIFLKTELSADIIYGNINLIDDKRNVFKSSVPKPLSKLSQEMCMFHPATFVNRRTYMKYGLYDCNLSLASDYKFLLTLYLNGAQFKYINKIFSFYDVRGATGNNIIRSWKELRLIQKEAGFSFYSYNYNFFILCSKRFIINCHRFIYSYVKKLI